MSANELTPSFKEEGLPTPPQRSPQASAAHASATGGSPSASTSTSRPRTDSMAHPNNNKGVLYNLFLGPGGAATMAGMCEIVIFHPFDTTAKRLMSYHQRVIDPSSFRASLSNANHVVFGGLEARYQPGQHIPFIERVKYMYPGSTYAVAYKVLQRIMKFAGQPYMRDYLHKQHAGVFFRKDAATGDYIRGGRGATMLEATAGCLVGVCEIVLLPFDRMKVLNQTNKAAVGSRGMMSIIRSEGLSKLYAGSMTTVVRNAPGSFLLFGGTAFTKEYVFKLKDYRDATFAQNIMASTVGSCVGVFFTSPMDVVKTRVQSQKLTEKKSGLQIFTATVKAEGFSAFYKGITPKLITSAPRLVFSYTMTQYFTKMLRGENKKPKH